MSLSKADLKKLKKALPGDGVSKIEKASGYSPSSIYQTLNKVERYNKVIIDAAIKVIENNNQMLASQKLKIKEVAS